MPRQRPSTTAFFAVILVVFLLLPAAYMGAYFALVIHTPTFVGPWVSYRIDGVEPFFRPPHWLDRQLRRDYWGRATGFYGKQRRQ